MSLATRKTTMIQPDGTGSLFQDLRPKNLSVNASVVHEWSFLKGFRVHVLLDNVPVRTGQVEDVTSDGRTLWISAEGPFGRQLVDKTSGYRVFMEADQFASLHRRLIALHSLFSPSPETA